MKEILLAMIQYLIAPAVVAYITSQILKKDSRVNFSRLAILTLITEDRLNLHLGKLPTNKEAILHEYDVYTKAGGNSYIKDKVEDYLKELETREG